MEYLEYSFSGFKDEDVIEILIALLDNAGYSGFLESGQQLKAYISSAERNESLLQDLLKDMEDYAGKLNYKCTKIPETNWNATWERNFKPVELGTDVYIRAPFHPPGHAYRHELIIEPKMSFGTGHHETTRLMIHSIFEIDLSAKKVLDMGCGTGVLSILASKMECASVLGIDIDDWACRNSRENVSVNDCSNIRIEKGDVNLIKDRQFHVILANINRHILLRDMRHYSNALLPDGVLVISGIMVQDKDMIIDEASRCRLIFQKLREENDWLSINFQKGELN